MTKCYVFHRKVCVSGPVELHDGHLQLRIPLNEGGKHLAEYAGSIGVIEEGELVVEILPWLAESLKIKEGSIVTVDNHDKKFRITPN